MTCHCAGVRAIDNGAGKEARSGEKDGELGPREQRVLALRDAQRCAIQEKGLLQRGYTLRHEAEILKENAISKQSGQPPTPPYKQMGR